MNELHITINAATLKHIVSTLARVDDSTVFEIKPWGISCRIRDAANAQVVSVVMPEDAFDECHADDMRVGIDLGWLSEILPITSDEDEVQIIIDEKRIHVRVGIDDNSTELLNPDSVRKPPERIELSHTVEMDVSGRVFKRMIDSLDAIKADSLLIRAGRDNVTFDSQYNMGSVHHYHAEADCLTEYRADARAMYSIDYLMDIAKGVPDDCVVTFQFGDHTPVLMTYMLGGCEVGQILAPRIEDD